MAGIQGEYQESDICGQVCIPHKGKMLYAVNVENLNKKIKRWNDESRKIKRTKTKSART